MKDSSWLASGRPVTRRAVCLVVLLVPFVITSPASGQEQELLYVGNNHGGTVSVISVPKFELIGKFDGVPDLADRETWPVSKRVDDLVAPTSGEVLYISRPHTRDIAALSTATEELLWPEALIVVAVDPPPLLLWTGSDERLVPPLEVHAVATAHEQTVGDVRPNAA